MDTLEHTLAGRIAQRKQMIERFIELAELVRACGYDVEAVRRQLQPGEAVISHDYQKWNGDYMFYAQVRELTLKLPAHTSGMSQNRRDGLLVDLKREFEARVDSRTRELWLEPSEWRDDSLDDPSLPDTIDVAIYVDRRGIKNA